MAHMPRHPTRGRRPIKKVLTNAPRAAMPAKPPTSINIFLFIAAYSHTANKYFTFYIRSMNRSVAIVSLLLFTGCVSQQSVLEFSPEDVVKEYFSSWGNKDYSRMYSLISDGFKGIDPQAKDLDTFSSYATSQGIEGIKIVAIKESSNNGIDAMVDYSVEFQLAGGKTAPFSGTYTLKKRDDDRIPGWKLIHPYGKNIDTS